MLIDPNGEGTANLQWLHRSTGGGRLHVLDVDTRYVAHVPAWLSASQRSGVGI